MFVRSEPADHDDFDDMSPEGIRGLLALLDVVEQLPAANPNHMLGPGAVQYAASTQAFLDDPANWELNVAEKGGLLRLFQELVKLERNKDGINELNRIMASNAALLESRSGPLTLPFSCRAEPRSRPCGKSLPGRLPFSTTLSQSSMLPAEGSSLLSLRAAGAYKFVHAVLRRADVIF